MKASRAFLLAKSAKTFGLTVIINSKREFCSMGLLVVICLSWLETFVMGKVQVRIKAGFGEVVVEGDSPQEVLDLLGAMSPNFMSEIDNLISTKLAVPLKSQLEGVIELTTEGPIITTREKLTHYEAVGLTLYASEDKSQTAAGIARLLESGGIRSQVPARLNEMAKRGLVFKPDPSRAEWRLTAQGESWVEEDVIVKLRGGGG